MISATHERYLVLVMLSVFFVLGAERRTYGQIPNLADLWISDVALDDSGQLVITVENVGRTYIPNNNSVVSVIHNEINVGDLWIGALNAGDVKVINTGIRLNGPRNARLLIIVDSNNKVEELNEYRNSVSINLPLPERTGFDLSVDAVINAGLLQFYVENHGNQATPANLPITITTRISGTLRNYNFTLPVVPAQTDPPAPPTVIDPGPVVVNSGNSIKLTISTVGIQDLDSTNDSKTIVHKIMSDVDSLYDPFLSANQNIKDAMTWPPCNPDTTLCPAGTPVGFDNWPQEMKDQLKNYLLLLEQGRNLPSTPLPSSLVDFAIFELEAKNIYLAYVAQSLWFELHGMEIHGNTNWTLTNLNTFELSKLFINSSTMYRPALDYTTANPTFFSPLNAHPWSPRILYRFMESMSMMGSSPEDITYNLLDWYRAFARHRVIADNANGETLDQLFGWPNSELPTDRLYYAYWGTDELPGIRDHVSWGGGWSATAHIVATLATVNIPAFEHIGLIFGLNANPELPNEEQHSQVTLPTVRKPCDGVGEPVCCFDPPCCASSPCADTAGIVIQHSDQVYGNVIDTWGGLGDASIASSWRLFYSFEEAEYHLGFPSSEPYVGTNCPETCNPQCDCVGGVCNSCVDQTQFSHDRRVSKMARQYLSGRWLIQRYEDVTNGTNKVDDWLRGFSSTPPFEFVQPYLPPTDRAEFITALDDKLEAIGASLGAAPANQLNAGGNYVRTDYVGSSAPTHNYMMANQLPVANAGSGYPIFAAGSSITLNGSGTDADASPNPVLSYLWTSDDPNITVINPDTATAMFVSPATSGSFTFRLTVYDGSDMDTDLVTITTDDSIAGLVEGVGCRYLGVTPGGTNTVAIKVTSPDLPCITKYAQADNSLGDTPLYQLPSLWNTAYVHGVEIIPSTQYFIALEKMDTTLIPIGNATTWLWGDVNNSGDVNSTDILAGVLAFQRTFIAATFEGVDIAPCITNDLVNVEDITWIVKAFQLSPFTTMCPSDVCP